MSERKTLQIMVASHLKWWQTGSTNVRQFFFLFSVRFLYCIMKRFCEKNYVGVHIKLCPLMLSEEEAEKNKNQRIIRLNSSIGRQAPLFCLSSFVATLINLGNDFNVSSEWNFEMDPVKWDKKSNKKRWHFNLWNKKEKTISKILWTITKNLKKAVSLSRKISKNGAKFVEKINKKFVERGTKKQKHLSIENKWK